MNIDLITLNVSLDTYSSVICLLIILSIFIRKAFNEKSTKWFVNTCVASFGLSVSDVFTWLYDGTDVIWRMKIFPVAHFIFYLCGALIFFCYLKYVIELLSVKVRISSVFWHIGVIFFGIYIIGLIITPLTGFYYIIDSNCSYQRGKYFWILSFVDGLFYAETILLILLNRKVLKKSQCISLIMFIIIPIIMQIIQVLNYGIALNCTGIAIAFLIIFINIQQRLEDEIIQKSKKIQLQDSIIIDIQDNTIASLANMVENRSADSGHHITRTREYIKILCEQCFFDGIFPDEMNAKFTDLVLKAAPMHDIGKIVVPDEILKKPGKLTDEEFEIVKKHTSEGGRIINEILGNGSDQDYLKIITQVAVCHHEKWDGTGYPDNLKAEGIPLSARIMAIADVFDALVTKRCYKEVVPVDEAFEIIKNDAGKHFDPILVKEFLKSKDKIVEILEQYNE